MNAATRGMGSARFSEPVRFPVFGEIACMGGAM
jgi:hypothetical protein